MIQVPFNFTTTTRKTPKLASKTFLWIWFIFEGYCDASVGLFNGRRYSWCPFHKIQGPRKLYSALLFTKHKVLENFILPFSFVHQVLHKVPDDDPEGNPQCFKEQKEDDMIETVYDASMLLVQVLRIIYIQYSWIENQNWNERVDWYMFLAHQYLVPVLVMAYTNGMIAYTLWKKREIGEVHVNVVFLWNWCESLKFQLRLH